MRLLHRLRPLLEHRHLPLGVALLAVLLTAPALTTGWVLDDYSQRIAALAPPENFPPGSGRLAMFLMSGDNPETLQYFKDIGFAPWWTPDDFKLGFWRPLSSLHHYLQYRLWPNTAWPMHLVGMAWLGAATFLAAVFYRRLIGAPWIAGLAALLYAIQPGHTMTAGWIANQNALLSVTFGLGAVLAHDRWRAGGWKAGAWLSPTLLGMAVLSAESGTAAGAYLLAYALFCDPAPSRLRRLSFIVPHAAVGMIWIAAYRAGGYQVEGSGFYIDPAGQPVEFAVAALQRVPIQLASIWTLLPATAVGLTSTEAQRTISVVCWIVIAVLLAAMIPLFKRDATSKFFLLATALSLLPTSATLPSERNFMWAGLGAMGLVAQWTASVMTRREEAMASGGAAPRWAPSRAAVVGASALLWLHLIFAPLSALANSRSFAAFKAVREDGFANVLRDSKVEEQTVVLVNPPNPFMNSMLASYRDAVDRPAPRNIRLLAAGVYPLTVTRLDGRTLAIRAEGGGLLQPAGTWDVPGQPEDPFFNVNYLTLVMDRVFRSEDRPFRVGDISRVEGMTAEVVEVAPGGGVNEVYFTFDVPLEHPSLRWIRWKGRQFVPFDPPAPGESVQLPAADLAELL